jgi:hypothetical protein
MNTLVVPAIELFTSDELVALENLVQNLQPLPKLHGPHREYARFIDLPKSLDERAKLPYENARRVEYDIDTETVRLYF